MLSLVLKTLVHYRSLLLPVVFGVAVASAVIVGALVVGDSMRGSLRFIAMDRIGSIDRIVLAPRWFREDLAKNLQNPTTPKEDIHPVILVQQAIAEKETARASEMALLGVDPSFWILGSIAPRVMPGEEEVVLNTTLAEKLQASVGDQITLRVASQAVVPADSPLGKREQDSIVLPRWKVVDIIADQSIARFSLRSDQRPIMNAFANKESLQKALEIPSQINAIFVANPKATPVQTASAQSGPPKSLLEELAPNLADLGMTWERVTRSFPEGSTQSVFDYHQLTTDQMLLTSSMSEPIQKSAENCAPKPVLTYLANGTQKLDSNRPVGRSVPYSTISAVEWSVLNTMLSPSGRSSELTEKNWVVVTQWMASELDVKVGDTIRIDYFLPETVDGNEIERSRDLVVAAIAPLTKPSSPYRRNRDAQFDESPTPFNDPAWTPVVPGITDQESISKWDTPFPLSRKIETQDDDYWNDHRLTPKLFVSYELGTELFGSRFGKVSSLRFDGLSLEKAADLEKQLQTVAVKEMESLGWRDIPLRKQQLMAASGTTPFDALFLSLSFFVIAAALLLVALLFRLAIEQRSNHWGLFLASGWTRASVRRLLLLEGGIVSIAGATLGVVLGLGYAYAMIAGLRTWWIGAITVSFLDYYASPFSLFLGWFLGWLTALLTIFVAARQLKQVSVARLLKNQMENEYRPTQASSRWAWLAIGTGVSGVAILACGQFLQGQAQAGAFVGGGMLFLVSGLSWILNSLRSSKRGSTTKDQGIITASALASSNAKRAPMRSALAIGLIAIASFLILSMSLFQSAPTEAGTGGFFFIGKSPHAIHKDLGSVTYQKDILAEKSTALEDSQFVPFRVRGGDDASCNNLFQANQPQVLGISKRMDAIDRNAKNQSAFAWFTTGKVASGSTPWQLLEADADGSKDSPLPVVLDQNTALWALHLGGYVGERFAYSFDDREVHFETVGVLQNTILQGSLIIGESNFERVFPSVTGFRMFLVKLNIPDGPTKLEKASKLRMVAEEGWSEAGLSLARSEDVLKQMLAVQNTYLGAFQVLGAIGLLLGTIGLGVAQLRSAIERRGELATMRAIGFTKTRLIWLLTLENAWQLFRGIGIGVGSAALATLPAILNGQPFAGLAWPATMLGLVIVSGLVCSVVAAWTAMRWPLLQSLRAS